MKNEDSFETLKVYRTKDYDKFDVFYENRPINRSLVKKIMSSLKKRNSMKYQPVVVDNKFRLIDGQHRFIACRNLGIEVYYVIGKGLGMPDARSWNASQGGWTMRNHCESLSKGGNEHYTYLLEFADKYSLPITVCASLLTSTKVKEGGGKLEQILKDGGFKATNKRNASEFVEKLNELRESGKIPSGILQSREFIRALEKAYAKGADNEILKNRFLSFPETIQRKPNHKEYLLVIERVYNYRTHGKNRINILQS